MWVCDVTWRHIGTACRQQLFRSLGSHTQFMWHIAVLLILQVGGQQDCCVPAFHYEPRQFWCVQYVVDIYKENQNAFVGLLYTGHAPHNDVSANDDLIYDGGPIILQYNITIHTVVLQLPSVFSTVTCCTGLYPSSNRLYRIAWCAVGYTVLSRFVSVRCMTFAHRRNRPNDAIIRTYPRR